MTEPLLQDAPDQDSGASRDGAGLPLPPRVPGGMRDHVEKLTYNHHTAVRLVEEGSTVSYLAFGPERLGARLAPRVALVTSARGAHDVLAGADGAVDKLGAMYESFCALSPNVFNLPHERWVPRKRALQPVFTKPRTREYAASISGVAAEAGPVWAEAGVLDVQEHARRLTTEILGQSLLGRELGSQADLLATAFEDITGYVLWRGTVPLAPPLWMPTPGKRRYRAAEHAVLELCGEALDEARRTGGEGAPLLRRLLEATDPVTGDPLTEDQRRNDLMTFMLAGHDTTASTLTYALWQLGRHPQWQDKVAAEATALGRSELTPADVERLPSAVHVLHEAMRLCPPAPNAVRQTVRDVAVDGFRIPAGWVLLVSIYALHRDPAVWEDAEKFDPSRWTRPHTRSRWQYLPFSGGQRKCIGDHFAMLEATIALASLVRDLVLTPVDDFEMEFAFTARSAGPVRMQVAPRI